LHWMDYSKPRKSITRQQYSEQVVTRVMNALRTIEHCSEHSLAMAEQRINIGRRTPSKDRRQWARPLNAARGDLLPRNRPEVYAYQAEWIHENPVAEVVLQAVRIGDLGMTAIPNEVYGITGLKLKRQSPLQTTLNLELANGAAGYIPPPEQHRLGGYTTWPARTAGLKEEAEPLIVETLLSLLEEVSGKERRSPVDELTPYARELQKRDPISHWPLNEMTSVQVIDSTGENVAKYRDGVALFLPGPGGDGFLASGYGNRSVYLAGGHLDLPVKQSPQQYTLTFWFQNMLPSGVRDTTGVLFSSGTETLSIGGDAEEGKLVLQSGERRSIGITPVSTGHWQQITYTNDGQVLRVYLDGNPKPEIEAVVDGIAPLTHVLIGSDGNLSTTLDGKVDEVAVFDQAWSGGEVATVYKASGMVAPPRPKPTIILAAKPVEEAARKAYANAVLASQPVSYWRLQDDINGVASDAIGKNHGIYEDGSRPLGSKPNVPNFSGGRIKLNVPEINDSYSIELWFRNELPVQSRPVTAYLFSRAIDGVDGAFGDNLGLGGTHSNLGQLIVFNGNRKDQLVSGKTRVSTGSWSYVVMVRQGQRIKVYLNGDIEPEIDGELPVDYPDQCSQFFIGGRADNFANLQGMLDEVAFYDRALTPAEIASHFQAAGAQQVSKPVAAVSVIQEEPKPTEVAEAIKSIHVPDGFEVQLVAAEPLVTDPVAIDWGPDGKLWVVEMADYPLGLDGKGGAGGRVRFLEDSNSDGHYDTSTLFADGLSFPNGVMVWGRGVLVTAAPEILYLEDTTGDGKADMRRTLYTGFLEGNQQLRVNGLRWGLDNWVYCASGSHHGGYGKDSTITSLLSGEVFSVGSRDFRVRPDTGQLDPQSGPSQYGRVRDDWGNWFGVQNSHPLWHYVLADHNIRRNSHYAPPNPKQQVITPSNPPVYPASKLQKRFHSFNQSGRFTSACSPLIYRDSQLFGQDSADRKMVQQGSVRQREKETAPEQHTFTCEPFHNLVQHNLLIDDGVSFSFRRDPGEQGIDFFASEDRWCRPVMVRTGPNGGLWVVDMYRYMIEHPDWLPEQGKNELRPWYRAGEDRGRIYRIVRREDDTKAVSHVIRKTVDDMILGLRSSNGWRRDTAQRMLVRGNHQQAIEPLQVLLETSDQPLTRLHALWSLQGLGQLTAKQIETATHDEHPGVRRNAVRLAASIPIAVELLVARVDDSDAKVRLELACTLGFYESRETQAALGRLILQNQDDHYIVAAAMSSLNARNVSGVLAEMLSSNAGEKLIQAVLGQAIAMGNAETINQVITSNWQSSQWRENESPLSVSQQNVSQLSVSQLSVSQQNVLSGDRVRFNSLALALDGLATRGLPLSELSEHACQLIDEVMQSARKCAADQTATTALRAASVKLLGRESAAKKADFELMQSLLAPRSAAILQAAVVSRLAQFSDNIAAEVLLSGWQSHTPNRRKQILEVLVSRQAWAESLRVRVEEGEIGSGEFTAGLQRRLIEESHSPEQWQALFETKGTEDRGEVLKRFQPAIGLDASPLRGRALFRKLCLNCHQLQNEGHAVGPQLASITNKSKEALLVSILDPNAAVDAQYYSYSVLTQDGRTHLGKLETETASSITLLAAEGKRTTVLRDQIEILKSSRKSLMPDGLEQELQLQDMADLIQYVQEAFR
ncbi:MAG: c-type cytochrome, partial [Planctomycetaceae bacterium]|nr:c-type cytochrome [Planctomycetaceae bacterium]